MNTDRMISRIYARMFGFFWIPCPRCGVEFGGHESGSESIPCDCCPDPGDGMHSHGEIVCKPCSEALKKERGVVVWG